MIIKQVFLILAAFTKSLLYLYLAYASRLALIFKSSIVRNAFSFGSELQNIELTKLALYIL